MPLVSVIIPTHNRPQLLKKALESVKAQTFTDYEIIVVSSNEKHECLLSSLELAVEFEAEFLTCNNNISTTRNYGIQHAKGTWIAFLDDDDQWLPKKLEFQIACSSNADLISCEYSEVNLKGEIIKVCKPQPNRWWAPPSCVLIKKSVLKSVNGFCPWMRYNEDNDLWRRVRWRSIVYQVPLPLVLHQRDPQHISMVKN